MNTENVKILPDNARVLIQGITGKEGSRAAFSMLAYGTRVLAGVTPGKGGGDVGGIPVFNSITEAVSVVGEIDVVAQFVPPLKVLAATFEALDANIPVVVISAEKVPVQDSILMRYRAKKIGALLVGPGSVGIISPEKKIKIGFIGGNEPERAFPPGSIAVFSKSGGMTSEIGIHLKLYGMGVSVAAGIGGEKIIGSDFLDFLKVVDSDPTTKATVIFGELGGNYEEKVAQAVKKGELIKPIVAFIVGEFVSRLNFEAPFGHAGAILEKGRGGVSEKRAVLKDAGVLVAEHFDDIAPLLKSALQ